MHLGTFFMKFAHYKITHVGIGNKGNSESNKVEH